MSKEELKYRLKQRVQSKLDTQGVEEKIQRRAYEMYLARRREDGHAEDDWLQAELELLRELRLDTKG